MSVRVKIQKFGSKLSSMVIPNLGAFIAWGLLTAVGIAIDNDMLRGFITPMLNYLLPLLIAFAGGKMVYDYRGGVIGTVATIGVIIGSSVTMFIGAMILGPLAAWLLKKFDELIDGKVPMGFELIVNNYSVGILGAILGVIGCVWLGPAISSLTNVFAGGVDFLVQHNLLPLTAILIEPAKPLFLNNAIGQGILTPMGTTQLGELGKSVLFLLESNPGPGMGVLLAYMFFGKGTSKSSAWGASVIHLFGGIHEIYFPFVLMNPVLILPLILGGAVGTLVFTLLNVGLVGVASPGSIISIMLMSSPGDQLKIILGVLAACAVTFLIAIPLVKRAGGGDDSSLKEAAKTMNELKGKKSRISSVFESIETFDFASVTRVAYACDAGIGSSAMGATILQKKFKAAGLDDVTVFHIAVENLPTDCQVVVTQEMLLDRVREAQPEAYAIAVTDFLNAPEYDDLIEKVKAAKGK
ncbi:PTS mannitol transporter subunit IICB [Agathobaculum sp.]|uniref:PTS mannitol transporter subunit IICB n=1 Tax=Agathobaculum sp. TaxID=2048138 RepID=UPI002A824D18|nr:PTS mannitol transporter subunit IICB [Agathobaculum sp.]MDY3618399.1 PTS mannitol transporter subunit IICB [Agathobaculum sp.]